MEINIRQRAALYETIFELGLRLVYSVFLPSHEKPSSHFVYLFLVILQLDSRISQSVKLLKYCSLSQNQSVLLTTFLSFFYSDDCNAMYFVNMQKKNISE